MKLKTLFTSSGKLNMDELIFKKTVIAFTVFFCMMGLAVGGWFWLRSLPKDQSGANAPVRNMLNVNESIFSGILSRHHLTKEYPVSLAANPARVNGNVGLNTPLDSAGWYLQVIRSNGDTLKVTLDELKKLPKKEIVFNFKCIEGWSQITHWAGVPFSEFVKAYGLEKEAGLKYAGLHTPDNAYYVGIDMPSLMHPQTILCYELNNQPLPLNQGYPLRLIIPVKYGVKHLKRIGTIFFSNERPPDYWAQRGYDYFTGL